MPDRPAKLAFAFVLSLLCAAALGQSFSERAARDELVFMAKEEPAMQAAFRKAAQTLPDFLAAAAARKEGTTGYALKVAVSDGKNTEYFWVADFAVKEDRFVGTLNNEPRLVKRYRLGERMEFTRSQIADWLYIDQTKRQMVGNFTDGALLSKEPPDQAEEMKRRYGLQCQ